MRRLNIASILILTLILTSLFISCKISSTTPSTPINASPEMILLKSLVQVWRSNQTFAGNGIIIRDGTQALTVLDYEFNDNKELYLLSQDHEMIEVDIVAVDPMTGATLLRLKDRTFHPADTNKNFLSGQGYMQGWPVDLNSLPIKVPINISYYDDNYFTGSFTSQNHIYNQPIATDTEDKIIGFASVLRFAIIPIQGVPEYIPPIVNINHVLNITESSILNPEEPAIIVYEDKENIKGYNINPFSDLEYHVISEALIKLTKLSGDKIPDSDIPENYFQYAAPMFKNGSLLTVVYTQPVFLQNSEGDILAQAKWIGVEWDRIDAKPNRLLFGKEAYTIDGGFILKGDVSVLENAVIP